VHTEKNVDKNASIVFSTQHTNHLVIMYYDTLSQKSSAMCWFLVTLPLIHLCVIDLLTCNISVSMLHSCCNCFVNMISAHNGISVQFSRLNEGHCIIYKHVCKLQMAVSVKEVKVRVPFLWNMLGFDLQKWP